MARPISDEELQLKKRARRRLVGAVVLVTAVAVILPMVLDSEPRPVSQNVDIQIPSPDAGELKPGSGAVALPGEASKSAAAPAAESPASPTEVAKAEPSRPIGGPPEPAPAASEAPPSEPVKTEAPKSEPTKAAAREPAPKKETAAKEPAAGAGSYVVQVAALSDAGKAKQLERQMAGAGLRTYTEVVHTPAGAVTRVRAGPYASREAAEKARTQLKKAGLDGKVVPK